MACAAERGEKQLRVNWGPHNSQGNSKASCGAELSIFPARMERGGAFPLIHAGKPTSPNDTAKT